MKRKRHKSPDSHHTEIVSATRQQKTRKRAQSSDSDQKEDGEISDDVDSDDDDSSGDRENSPIFQRKEIVYEIDDDSCSSSNGSGRNSPYNNFSGETVCHTNQIEK